jgi:WD40 repeat protein
LEVSDDGKTLSSLDGDDVLKFWDLESGRLLRTIKSKFRIHSGDNSAFTGDGKHFFAGTYKGGVVFDVDTGNEVWRWDKGFARISPDKRKIILYDNSAKSVELRSFGF